MTISVIRLWETGVLSVRACRINIDCGKLVGGTPRLAYLVPDATCCSLDGSTFRVVTTPPADMTNVLTGVLLLLKDGRSIVADAVSVADITEACNSCCGEPGDTVIVAGRYNGTFPFVIGDCEPVLYEFGRQDYGDVAAYSKALMDYSNYAIPNTFQTSGREDDVTYYRFMACPKPVFYQDDIIGPYYHESNNAGSINVNQRYWFTLEIDGTQVGPAIIGTTVAEVLEEIQADPILSQIGTWSQELNHINLETMNWRPMTLLIQEVAGHMYYTNGVAMQPSERATFSMTVAPSPTPLPPLPAGTLEEIAAAANADPDYNQYGIYTAIGTNQIELNAYFTGGYTLTLTKVQQTFQSNDAPAKTVNQAYTVNATIGGTILTPINNAADLDALLALIQGTSEWSTKGTWAISGQHLTLTTTLIIPAATIVISLTSGTFLSNSAPQIQAPQRYTISGTVGDTTLSPIEDAANLAALLAAIQADTTWNALGTWSIVGDQIQLVTTLVLPSAPSLVIALQQEVFDSNVAPTLAANEHYSLSGTVGGETMALLDGGTTLDTIIAAAEGDGLWGGQGTYSKTPPANNALRLTTTIIEPPANIIIGKMTGTFVSNQAPALATGERITVSGTARGAALPIKPNCVDINEVLARIQGDTTWNALGTWSLSGGNAIQLVTTFIDPTPTITLSKTTTTFSSNTLPTLTGGQTYTINATVAGNALPEINGAVDASALLAAINANSSWTAMGTWTLGTDTIDLQTTFVSPAASIVVTAV